MLMHSPNIGPPRSRDADVDYDNDYGDNDDDDDTYCYGCSCGGGCCFGSTRLPSSSLLPFGCTRLLLVTPNVCYSDVCSK